MTWQKFKEYMDQHTDIQLVIEGGGDSGNYNIQNCDNKEVRDILERILEDTFSYGSFAGEFQVNINGGWNSKESQLEFEGEDISYETPQNEIEHTISIPVSSDILKPIDSVNIYYNLRYGDENDSRIKINIKNGIWKEEFDKLEEQIKDAIDDVDMQGNENCTIDEVIIPKDGKIEFTITSYNDFVEDKSEILEKDEIIEYLETHKSLIENE